MKRLSRVEATAPGKVILFGEHAVVYGRPAIAAPLSQVRATAVIEPNRLPGVRLVAPDLGSDTSLSRADHDDPIAEIMRQLKRKLNLPVLPDMVISVSSQIPVASGLGSGAAITAAVARAALEFLDMSALATNEWISSLTYEVEKLHHGTPSGIDNTVVTYEQPVYFVRRQPANLIQTFPVAVPLRLLVADSGVRSKTKDVVGDVRRQWQADSRRLESMFDECGRIAQEAKAAIEGGGIELIGRLMTENHSLLRQMSVSLAKLDRLVDSAVDSGALGAKLSGAGRGGNMIALVAEEAENEVRRQLLASGAQSVLTTVIG